MSKEVKKINKKLDKMRNELEFMYLNKYYNLYMNNFIISQVDYQMRDYILRKFWADGTLAEFKLSGSEGSTDYPKGMPVFCPYAPSRYNLYDFPIDVSLINIRGVKFIPATPQKVDEDVILLYAQRNKKSIYSIVSVYVDMLVDIEMVIKINLMVQKSPWIIGTSPESQFKAEELANKILDDNPFLFVELEEIDKAKALISGAPYVLDKLYNLKTCRENELREFLGISNLGVIEKKEHLVTDEISANNDITKLFEDSLLDMMQESFDRGNKLFGFDIKVELNHIDREKESNYEEEEEDEDNDE